MKCQTPCVAALLLSVMILTCAQALDLHTVRSLRLYLVLNSAAAPLLWQQLMASHLSENVLIGSTVALLQLGRLLAVSLLK